VPKADRLSTPLEVFSVDLGSGIWNLVGEIPGFEGLRGALKMWIEISSM
jgi:hypothetical protein